MNYAEFLEQDRRLVLLKGLEGATQFTSNSFVLGRYAAAVGHSVSADRLSTDLTWLQEQGLVELEKNGAVLVAKLTMRGLDVATGRATVPGVQKPQPGI